MTEQIEELFDALATEEKLSVISHGVALRLSDLQKRLSMAEGRVRGFEEKHGLSLDELDEKGLPDNASYEIHEDYIMWHHWVEVVEETRKRIDSLQKIADQGLYVKEILRAGD